MSAVHLFIAVRRHKDNDASVPHVTFREVCGGDEQKTINRLKDQIAAHTGVWRIYRTVNARDVKKSELELIKTLIDRQAYPLSVSDKPVISLWKTILMQPRNKAEKKFLIDIDDKDRLQEVTSKAEITIKIIQESPNGYHVVAEPFDLRILEGIPDVSVQKDGMIFVELCEVEE